MRRVSTTSFQNSLSRSKKPLWSRYCRSSSTGGCAPYVSVMGMLTSSTKMTHFLLAAAPMRFFLFFSILASMVIWTTSDAVWAEKFTGIDVMPMPPSSLSGASCSSSLLMTVVFPVPVTPVTKTGLLISMRFFMMKLKRTVSAVGTTISKYDMSGTGSNAVTIVFQFLNSFSSRLTK